MVPGPECHSEALGGFKSFQMQYKNSSRRITETAWMSGAQGMRMGGPGLATERSTPAL